LSWSSVKQTAIVCQSDKSEGRKSVPLLTTDAVLELITSLERASCPTVLSALEAPLDAGGPQPRQLGTTSRHDADEAARKRERLGTNVGRDSLPVHDLSGTAATTYILAGLPLDDVATISRRPSSRRS